MFAKIIAIFSLTLTFHVGSTEPPTDEPLKGCDGDDFKIATGETLGPPTSSDFEKGHAALRRMASVNELQDRVPRNLISLNDAFNDLAQKVRQSEKADDMDIILLIDTNGKTQTAAAAKFLANLENALKDHVRESRPNLKVNLACVVDSFASTGSGVIPAAVGALGHMTQEEALGHIWEMPVKMLYPKSIISFCGCCGCVGATAGTLVSAYFSVPEIAEEGSPDWRSLIYDAIDFAKGGHKELTDLFGSHTVIDLNSSLETVSLKDSDLIQELAFYAITSRDDDARSSVKRIALSEVLSCAEKLVAVASHSSAKNPAISRKLEKVSDELGHFNVLLKKSLHKKYGGISELRDLLMKQVDIPRDMVILNISTDTFAGKIMVPSFSYDLQTTDSGKMIVNLNYRFAIPSHFYDPKKGEAEIVRATVEAGVNSVFPFKNARKSNISTATGLLINFLNECNDRVILAADDAHIFDQPRIDEEDSEEDEEV